METIVVFDSLHGNTERVAHAIGDALAPLGDVRVLRTTDVPPDARADAWVVGGPTHNHGLSKPLSALLKTMAASDGLKGIPVATFDTRYHYPWLMSGSAAHSAAGKLRRTRVPPRHRARELLRPGRPAACREGGKPLPETEHLAEGELDRARAWGSRAGGPPRREADRGYHRRVAEAVGSESTGAEAPAGERYLLLADISGYTGFMSGVEEEHGVDFSAGIPAAYAVLGDLLDAVVEGVRPDLALVKLEGDAVFAAAPAAGLDGQGDRVLQTIQVDVPVVHRGPDTGHPRERPHLHRVSCRRAPGPQGGPPSWPGRPPVRRDRGATCSGRP